MAPPPPLRGKGGSRASTVAAALSAPAKRGRGTARRAVEGVRPASHRRPARLDRLTMTGAVENLSSGRSARGRGAGGSRARARACAGFRAPRHQPRRSPRGAGTARARRRGDPGILAPRAARARRLPHDRGRGRGALCRQGALDQEAHRRLHGARAPAEPHRPHGRADALDGVRHHRIGRRGAAARGQSHQAAQAALQRDAARRQELPLYPHLHRASGGEAHQASRRALARGRLFRPVRQRRRGVSHPQRAPAGVSPAHLLGQFLRQSDPALPALSDQALLGALHGRDRRSATTRSWSRRRATSSPAAAARSRAASAPK